MLPLNPPVPTTKQSNGRSVVFVVSTIHAIQSPGFAIMFSHGLFPGIKYWSRYRTCLAVRFVLNAAIGVTITSRSPQTTYVAANDRVQPAPVAIYSHLRRSLAGPLLPLPFRLGDHRAQLSFG